MKPGKENLELRNSGKWVLERYKTATTNLFSSHSCLRAFVPSCDTKNASLDQPRRVRKRGLLVLSSSRSSRSKTPFGNEGKNLQSRIRRLTQIFIKSELKALISLAVLPLCLAGCSYFLSSATRESKNWDFVQSVGGLKLGAPCRNPEGHVLLPITCDVFGTKKITKQPTTMNSALACDTPSVHVQGHSIGITVRTTIVTDLNRSADCPPADLGVIEPGAYEVWYLSPNGIRKNLGTIVIQKL